MEAIFSLKIWGSHRVYLYAELERFDTMIIYESMRIRHELNTNWYDAVRCNTQKIKSSNGRLWGCQTGAKSEHPKVVQNSSFEWVVEWLL